MESTRMDCVSIRRFSLSDKGSDPGESLARSGFALPPEGFRFAMERKTLNQNSYPVNFFACRHGLS
jgi:hypothetical protein